MKKYRHNINVSITLIFSALIALTLVLMPFSPAFADDTINLLKQKIYNEHKPEDKLKLMLDLSEKYVENEDRQGILIATQALKLAETIESDSAKAKALNLLGISWKIAGDNSRSVEYLFEALNMYNQMKMPLQYADVMKNIGETYRAAANMKKSMQYLYLALQIFERHKDSIGLARTYNRLAATSLEIYYNSEEYIKTFDSTIKSNSDFEKAVQLHPSLRQKDNLINFFLQKSLQLAERMNLPEICISSNIIQAALFNSRQRKEDALKTFNRVLEIIDSTHIDTDLPLALYNIAVTYFGSADYDKALSYAMQSYSIANEKDIKMYIILNTGLISDIYLAKGKVNDALGYLQEHYSNREEYYKSDVELRINTLQYEYEIEKKETEIRQQAAQKFNLLIFFSSLLLLIVTIIVILFLKNKGQARLNKELNIKNQIILEQNSQLKIINIDKDKFFTILAHDLRSPMSGFLGLTNIMVEEITQLSSDEIKKIVGTMRTSALSINRLLENLLEWAKVQRGITKCEPVTTLLNPIIMRLAELMKTYASGKDITMKIDIAQHIMIHADKHMFDTVMRNLISNAIKFSMTGSEIIISAVVNQEGIVTISVKDHGIGMNADQLGSLFEINLQANRKGTAGEPSTGLGLILSKEFVEMNGGKIWAESIEHEGSTFHFTLHANA